MTGFCTLNVAYIVTVGVFEIVWWFSVTGSMYWPKWCT